MSDKVLLAVDLRAMVDRRTSIPDVEDAIHTALGKMGEVVFLNVKLVTTDPPLLPNPGCGS